MASLWNTPAWDPPRTLHGAGSSAPASTSHLTQDGPRASLKLPHGHRIQRQKERAAHFAQSAAGKEQLRRQKYEQWRMAGTPPPMPRQMPMLATCIRARPLTAAPYHPAARTACLS